MTKELWGWRSYFRQSGFLQKQLFFFTDNLRWLGALWGTDRHEKWLIEPQVQKYEFMTVLENFCKSQMHMKHQGKNLTSTPNMLVCYKHPITKIQNLLCAPLAVKLKLEMTFYGNLMKQSAVRISLHSNFDQFLINLVTMVTGFVRHQRVFNSQLIHAPDWLQLRSTETCVLANKFEN